MKALVVEQLNRINIFVWCLISLLFPGRTYFFSVSQGLENSRLLHLAALFGLEQLDFNRCRHIDPAQSNHDNENRVGIILDLLLKDASVQRLLRLFLKRCGMAEEGLMRPIIKSLVEGKSNDALRLSQAIKLLLGQEMKVYVVFQGQPFTRYFFSEPNVRVLLWPGYLSAFFRILVKAGGLLLHKGLRPRRKPGEAASCPENSPNLQDKKVLFFPHQSIFYGKLFSKAYFHEPDCASPLHKSNILHVEHFPPTSSAVRDLLREQARQGYPTFVMGRPGTKRMALSCMRHLWSFFRVWRPVGSSVAFMKFYILFARFQIQFDFYRAEISRFPAAKLAIAGYDVLFPKPLSLALMSSGVHVAAIQERAITPYCNNFSYIFDTYYCSACRAKELLEKNSNFHARRLVPAGQIRSDFIRQHRAAPDPALEEIKASHKLMVALDFHSYPTLNEKTYPDIHWDSNKQFYLDLIKIAVTFPEFFIIVRGKNAEWLENPSFSDIARVFDALPNIQVSTNYEDSQVSYHLCAHADLVLGKYTSLVDECLVAGKQVIVHEYSDTYDTIISNVCDYGSSPIFVKTWAELHQALRSYCRDGQVLQDREQDELLRNFEALPCGNITEFIRTDLKNMLAGERAHAFIQ